VSNENGTASKIAKINVIDKINLLEESSYSGGSSSEGSSSGGSRSVGGEGGSPEPASNVEVKETSQTFIAGEKSAKFDFPGKSTSVVYVSFDSKRTFGKTTAITEMLKGKSFMVSQMPSEEVYKSLNIWVGNSGLATPKNIENAVVCFKVEKSWIQDKNIDRSSITLNRYNDKKWNPLSTNLSGEDDSYLYFTAKTPGFSSFAITGKTAAKAAVTETQSKPNYQGLEQNNGTTEADIEQTPGQKQSTNTSGKGSTKAPGFEMFFGIVSLFAVFLYKRK
jgi:PGF-pre-PGF domain-containing protein